MTADSVSWRIDDTGSQTSLEMDWTLDGALVSAPAVADVDADGRQDLVLATAERIFALANNGVTLTGFPRRLYDLFPLPDTHPDHRPDDRGRRHR